MEEERFRFLQHLPPETSEYQYSGFEDLQKAVQQERNGSFVIFTGVPLEEIDAHDEDFPGRIDYSFRTQTLILKIVSLPYEELAQRFGAMMGVKATEMAVRRRIACRGASFTKTPDRVKQADTSYGPNPKELPQGRTNQWPTLVVEVAYSDAKAKVKQDIAWWLNASAGDIKLGITFYIQRPSTNIYITKWKRGSTTPNTTNPEPNPVAEIKIERGGPGQRPLLTGDELVIPFEELFLREPRDSKEKNFVFSKEDLMEMAESAWEYM